MQDGWVPGKNLFDVDEAIGRGTIIMNLLSDAAQSETWPAIKPQIVKGKVRFIDHFSQFACFSSPFFLFQAKRKSPLMAWTVGNF